MKKIVYGILSFLFIFGFSAGLVGLNATSFLANAEETEIKIGSVEEYNVAFGAGGTAYAEGAQVVLTGDIDFQGSTFEFSGNEYFTGTFDGKGYSVKNINIKSDCYFGLIPYAKGNAKISAVKVQGASFDFSDVTSVSIYAGTIVGYGDNITIENCEIENSQEETPVITETLSIAKKTTFGGFAGVLKGSSTVKNCNSYYNVAATVSTNQDVAIAGVVGELDGGYVLNVLNFGNLSVSGEDIEYTDDSKLCTSGLVARVNSSTTKIKNSCFDGTLSNNITIDGHVFNGAIIGRSVSQNQGDQISHCYYTQAEGIRLSGDGYLESGTFLAKVGEIDRDFVADKTNFDGSTNSFDIEPEDNSQAGIVSQIWMIKDSQIRLQHFQTFSFLIKQYSKPIYDVTTNVESLSDIKYGRDIILTIVFKDDKGTTTTADDVDLTDWYTLNAILLDNTAVSDFADKCEMGEGKYTYTFKANYSTAGSYSFTTVQKEFPATVEVADSSQGGVSVTGASSTTDKLSLKFNYTNNKNISVTAKGKGLFTFEKWELYTLVNQDWVKNAIYENSNSTFTITYGEGFFEDLDKQYKIVATFDDSDAIAIGFGDFDTKAIQSITVAGQECAPEGTVRVSNKSVIEVKITTNKGYEIDFEAITRTIQSLLSDGETYDESYKIESAEVLGGGNTYSFNIRMSELKPLDENLLSLPINASGGQSDSLGTIIIIVVVVALVLIIATVVIIVVVVKKKKNGGGKGGKGGKTKSSSSKVSLTKSSSDNYKDYYI